MRILTSLVLPPLFSFLLSAADPTPPKPVQIPIKQYKLDNGLRVILSEDHSAPTYSIAVTYNVGSHNEKPGRTGFAHLFEHMMYQGSQNVGKGEHFALVSNNGGNMNGTTTEDRTNYFQNFPANQLDLGLFLEADRMRSLVINKENLDNQRNAVQEERRMRVDNQPYGKTNESMADIVFDNFANKHSVIGSMDDLNAASVQDVQDFFRIYYAPNNAVVTLVGDFKPDEALVKIKKYFGGIPKQPAPPVPDLAEKPQTGERRKTLEDSFAQLQRVDMVFRIPPGNTDDWYALSILGNVLGDGQSSRIYQSLVKDKEVAAFAGGFVKESRGPGLMDLVAIVRPGKDAKDAEKAISAEIERVKSEPISDGELEKARINARRQSVQEMQGTLPRAMRLGEMAVFYDDPNLVNSRLAKLQHVSKDDVQRVAKKFLAEDNRTVLTTLPKPKTMSAPKPPGE